MRTGDRLSILRWQYELAWGLGARFHLPDLDDRSCLWESAPGALTVRRDAAGVWRADWPDEETDGPRAVTIGWLTWHVQWWWGELLARSLGIEPTAREDVPWAGSAEAVRIELGRLHEGWTHLIGQLTEDDLERPFAFPWTEPRPFAYALAWANGELMKNLAEVGVIRHQILARRAAG